MAATWDPTYPQATSEHATVKESCSSNNQSLLYIQAVNDKTILLTAAAAKAWAARVYSEFWSIGPRGSRNLEQHLGASFRDLHVRSQQAQSGRKERQLRLGLETGHVRIVSAGKIQPVVPIAQVPFDRLPTADSYAVWPRGPWEEFPTRHTLRHPMAYRCLQPAASAPSVRPSSTSATTPRQWHMPTCTTRTTAGMAAHVAGEELYETQTHDSSYGGLTFVLISPRIASLGDDAAAGAVRPHTALPTGDAVPRDEQAEAHPLPTVRHQREEAEEATRPGA